MSARAWGWIAPISVALFAFTLRIWNIGYPNRLLFDETYYAKDGYSLLQHGYVQDFAENANDKILARDYTGLFEGEPTQIVHPDAGKWLIAAGEQLWGMNPFGWRFAAAVVGSLTVLVLARLVIRLTGSVVVGSLAGFLLAVDGMHFVLSRLALLDVFLTFWIVCAVACLVADRDWITRRLTERHRIRPWQIAAGVCFGLGLGTKWNAIYVLAAFGLLVVAWEALARKQAGDNRRVVLRFLVLGVPAFVMIVGTAFLVYVATWTGWLIHHELYEARFGAGFGDNRAWGAYLDSEPTTALGNVVEAFRSLWHYHVMQYDFHTGSYLAGKTHPYESSPAGWLVLERPVGVDVTNDLPASSCGAPSDSSCMRQILILGNPVIWWSGAAALLVALVAWIRTGAWRWGIPVVGLVATWAPWFMYDDRPIFSFYAVVTLPFTIIAICLIVASLLKHARRSSPRRRGLIWAAVIAYALLSLAVFIYLHPLYTDDLIGHDSWRMRIWFGSWV